MLIDSGCSLTLIGETLVRGEKRMSEPISLRTVAGGSVDSDSFVWLRSVESHDGYPIGSIKAHVVKGLPLGVDLIIGMDVISRVGLSIKDDGKTVHLGMTGAIEPNTSLKTVEDCDFQAKFDGSDWTVKWHWKDTGSKKERVASSVNFVKKEDEQSCDEEIREWIREGILVKYDQEEHGQIKHVLPVIAVRQIKGGVTKTRPVLDYRIINENIESHPGGAMPTCADRLREWRQNGSQCGLVDLRRAYLQIHIDRDLWTSQTIHWQGETYLLTRLGFGLASAPKIMTKIVSCVLQENEKIEQGVSSYIDDLYVNEEIVPIETVVDHLKKWGLKSKPPERLGSSESVRVLGLSVDQFYRWRRDGALPIVSGERLTRRETHKILGEWLGHFPVAGWMRVVAAYVQRTTAKNQTGWDDQVSDEVMEMMKDTDRRLRSHDPAQGCWIVHPTAPITIWADASSLAFGVALEIDGNIVEDASWLRPKEDSAHINICELDAVIRGLNLALRWKRKEIEIRTDSSSVFGWLNAIVTKTQNVKTRSLYEVLIRRRLNIIDEIIDGEGLSVVVKWVRSENNKADCLTRVPAAWLRRRPKVLSAAVIALEEDVKTIHEISHFGVAKTLTLARERLGNVSEGLVKKVISQCDACARIDPAPRFQWNKGSLGTERTWQRLAVDITHVNHVPYLSIIDTASKFTIWRRLSDESSREVVKNLTQVIAEFGPPESIMSDNGTVFRSREYETLLKSWQISQTLSCAFRPQGNAIVERIHRTVKRAVKRSGRTVEETVFWVNNTCTGTTENDDISPYEYVFSARARKPGINDQRVETFRPSQDKVKTISSREEDPRCEENPYLVGDRVYLRRPTGRCDDEWSGPEIVTEVRSNVSVVLNNDGISRHISHLRLVPAFRSTDFLSNDTMNSENARARVEISSSSETDCETESDSESVLRRSSRIRHAPVKFGYEGF